MIRNKYQITLFFPDHPHEVCNSRRTQVITFLFLCHTGLITIGIRQEKSIFNTRTHTRSLYGLHLSHEWKLYCIVGLLIWHRSPLQICLNHSGLTMILKDLVFFYIQYYTRQATEDLFRLDQYA